MMIEYIDAERAWWGEKSTQSLKLSRLKKKNKKKKKKTHTHTHTHTHENLPTVSSYFNNDDA